MAGLKLNEQDGRLPEGEVTPSWGQQGQNIAPSLVARVQPGGLPGNSQWWRQKKGIIQGPSKGLRAGFQVSDRENWPRIRLSPSMPESFYVLLLTQLSDT